MHPRKRGGLADWRSVRVWESDTRHHLRRRHALWFHGWCVGLLVLGTMWAAAHLQMLLGSGSLALRYLVTLGLGYAAFLAVLRLWAGWLVRAEPARGDVSIDPGDLPDVANLAGDVGRSMQDALPTFRSGGGGDFGGAGAEADFGAIGDAGSSLAGDVAGGALEAVGSLDEGAVVVVPVLAIFAAVLLVLLGGGSLLLVYFGSEALLAVAVEVAFGYAAARTAVRVVRHGWVDTVLRLTWKPLLAALVCAVLLGALVDHFVPQARSLPHAVKLLRGAA
jgi:hypothetical protein